MEYLGLINMTIKKMKRKKPRFLRQEATYVKKLGDKWRSPKGTQSKTRKKKKGKRKMPNPGYGSPKIIRGLHPSGFKEALVCNLNDLNDLNPKTHACRIASSVGKKKKLEIMKKASEFKLKILNPYKAKQEEKIA